MKNAIVIGASSGIGKEVARLMAKDGYKVGITGRRTALLKELKEENPDRYIVKSFDNTDLPTAIENLDAFAAEMGTIDVVFISSGVGNVNMELDFEIEKQTIMTNVVGFTNIVDWSVKFFIKQGYGHLAAVTSIAAVRGRKEAPAYFATKAYGKSYLEAMRGLVKQNPKIRISDIRPGFVDTDLVKGNKYLMFLIPLNKASRRIYKAISHRKQVAYITKRWAIIAFIMKITPKWLYDRI
ncbi:MAG: SDR family NAD(P)-dependent oxidoreductase [Bacteroidales bacterium]|jgi:short-subunit dehydrogenase|nr:SDR family NAD(P)-dependent oxidoreductase [Bacteroidales bacterium]